MADGIPTPAQVMDWFRSYHGAPVDSKWLSVARRASEHCTTDGAAPVSIAHVVAVWWTLLDHASQQSPRGSIATCDPESMGDFLGLEERQVMAIIHALHEKALVSDGMIVQWAKRQPEREDSSAVRTRRYRARQTTEAPAAQEDATTPAFTYPEAFEAAWRAYPTRSGNSKREAYRAWRARVNAGADPAALLAGTERYAAFIRATHREGSEYVKMAKTFYGPGEHYAEAWETPRPAGRTGASAPHSIYLPAVGS
ncbi:MAG TPA: hypothetical protein VFW98_08205 [Gemmatimonadaceae bacterium]|nr:hypothetical protein [Gemmatimonadaceae bacterium]